MGLFLYIYAMRRVFYFLCFFVATTLWGQKISKKRIARKLSKIEVFQQAHVGISISLLEETESIADYQGSKYMTPASNTKLLTFLGASQQFKSFPALAYVKENDSIIHFKSTGYPLLFHPYFKDSILDSFFDKKYTWNYYPIQSGPKHLGSGWAWDDYSYYYASETSAFPIYGNTIRAFFDNDKIKIKPTFFETKTLLDTTSKAFVRDYKNNTYRFNPKQWKVNDTLYRPFVTSDSLFVCLLEENIDQKIDLISDSS